MVKDLRGELVNDESTDVTPRTAHEVSGKRTDHLEQKEEGGTTKNWRREQNIRQRMEEIGPEKLSSRTRTPFFMEQEDR